MFLIPQKRVWTQQPQGACAINFAQYPRCIAAFRPGISLESNGLVLTPPALPTANVTRVNGHGLGAEVNPFDISSGFAALSMPSTAIANADDNLTIIWSGSIKNISDPNGYIFARGYDYGGGGWSIYAKFLSPTTLAFGIVTKSPSTVGYTFSIIDAFAIGNDETVALRLSHGSAKGYHRRSRKSTSVATGTVLRGTSESSLRLGGDKTYVNGGHTVTDGFIVIKDALADSEIWGLLDNPWQIFKAPDSRIFVPVSAGGGSSLAAAASGSDTASGTANLAAQVALGAIGVSLASGIASASVAVPLSATGLTVAGGSANGTATVSISAAGLAQAAGQAGLSAAVLLQAAGAAQSSGNATLAAQLSALASGSAQASGSANLSGGAPGALSAVGSATAGGAAVLNVSVQLVASGSAQASGSATGTANAPGAVSASGSAQAGGSGTASVTVSLTAAGFVQAMGAGFMSVQAPMSAIGASFASGSAVGVAIDGATAIVWPLASQVLAGISYGPTGTEYIGTLLPGSGSSLTAAEIADEIMLRLNTTPIEVTALNIPTVTQTADAVWAKVLP